MGLPRWYGVVASLSSVADHFLQADHNPVVAEVTFEYSGSTLYLGKIDYAHPSHWVYFLLRPPYKW